VQGSSEAVWIGGGGCLFCMLFPCRYVGMFFWNMHVLIELIIILKALFFVTSTIYRQKTLLQEPVISGIRAAFVTYLVFSDSNLDEWEGQVCGSRYRHSREDVDLKFTLERL